MAHAPTSTCFAPHGDGSIQGSFFTKEFDTFFEFSTAAIDEQFFGPKFDSKVWLSNGDFRLAQVKKTVAHVVVDEGFDGQPVVETWQLKKFQKFTDPRV